MNKHDLFHIWVPDESPWSDWAKPVLFAHWVDMETPASDAPPEPDVSLLPAADGSSAIVLDLEGLQSVTTAIALAKRGYRPVPLFNACPAPAGVPAVVDVRPILWALASKAGELAALRLAPDAPPVFLLDAGRRWGAARPRVGSFDNRSVSFVTDFPSANFLLSRGISRAILVQAAAGQPQEDLAHTLRRWQQAKIAIEQWTIGSQSAPISLNVRRPTILGWLGFRLLTMLRLKRNPLGGFGGLLAESAAG